jgi:hypothetical protein
MTQSFLHERCKANMCQDCIDLAEEYQILDERRRAEMIQLDEEIEAYRAKLRELKTSADLWEQIARTGLPALIEAWAAEEIDRIIKP